MSRATLNGLFALALFAVAAPSHAGFGDALKKMKEQSGKKSKEAIDKAVQVVETPAAKPDSTTAAPTGKAGAAAPAATADGSATKVAQVSTKFDYVPGDSVLLSDDFTQDELGEFPARWHLSAGTFEVAEMKGERWLRCTSDDGRIGMKMSPGLPEFWTLEFDAYGFGPDAVIYVTGLDDKEGQVWQSQVPHGYKNLAMRCGDIVHVSRPPRSIELRPIR